MTDKNETKPRKFRVRSLQESAMVYSELLEATTPEAAVQQVYDVDVIFFDSPEDRNYSLYQEADNENLYAVVEYSQCKCCKQWFDVNLWSQLCSYCYEDLHNPSR